MSIYQNFKPTFLYIKRHVKTGKLYFGKTTKRNVERYKGSGVYWLKHLKKHGCHIETVWYCLFLDQSSIKEFAIMFSKMNNIVDSLDWANLQIETGLANGPGFDSEKARKNALEQVENRTHIFQQKEFIESQTSRKSHHWIKNNPNTNRLKNGTHNFLRDDHPMKIRSQNGKHHFIKNNPCFTQLENSAHSSQIKLCCIFCKREISLAGKSHIDTCKLNPNRKKMKQDHSKRHVIYVCSIQNKKVYDIGNFKKHFPNTNLV